MIALRILLRLTPASKQASQASVLPKFYMERPMIYG
jgi:hypothetical protein